MIGYYVHHQGRGHLHRAQALANALEEPVAGLSSLPPPATWQGPWLRLARDDAHPPGRDTSAGGQLHWAPESDPGLRQRASSISSWIESNRPRLIVVDVSVEVALLARLHGVPVVSLVLPGRRTDNAHLLGFRASTALVSAAPPGTGHLHPELPQDVSDRVHFVGAISRFPVRTHRPERIPGPRRVVVLQGQGGGSLTTLEDLSLRALASDWDWTMIGGPGTWVEDPSALLLHADVVVTNAGESALADVAAHRRPAIVIPARRPFDEQQTTAAVLAEEGWPALVLPEFPTSGWDQVLEHAVGMDGQRWQDWCDGHAAARLANLLRSIPHANATHAHTAALRSA